MDSVFNGGIKTGNYDTDVNLNGSAPEPLPNGWYKIKLIREEEEKLTKKGNAKGQMFVFAVDGGKYDGREVKMWFCTKVKNPSEQWQLDKTTAFFVRAAQCCGVKVLKDTKQIYAVCFYAFLTQQKTMQIQNSVDETTGEIKTEEIPRVNMIVAGSAEKNIISVEDYGAMNDAQATKERRFTKKSESADSKEDGADDNIPF